MQEFPKELQALNKNIETVIYPSYKTKGQLDFAVENLYHYITKTIKTEKLVLVGHSMGGILAVECVLKHNLKTIGIICFDTPFFGLDHINLGSSIIEKYKPISNLFNRNETLQKASTSSDKEAKFNWSSYKKVAAIGALTAAASAVALGSYYYKNNRESMKQQYDYMAEHLEFINELAKPSKLKERMKRLKESAIKFKCYYIQINKNNKEKTFVKKPGNSDAIEEFYLDKYEKILIGEQCRDEILAHTKIFNKKTNKEYDVLLKSTSQFIDTLATYEPSVMPLPKDESGIVPELALD